MALESKHTVSKQNRRTPAKALAKRVSPTINKGEIIGKKIAESGKIEPSLQLKYCRTGTRSFKYRRTLLKKGTDSEKLVNLRFQPLFGD